MQNRDMNETQTTSTYADMLNECEAVVTWRGRPRSAHKRFDGTVWRVEAPNEHEPYARWVKCGKALAATYETI